MKFKFKFIAINIDNTLHKSFIIASSLNEALNYGAINSVKYHLLVI